MIKVDSIQLNNYHLWSWFSSFYNKQITEIIFVGPNIVGKEKYYIYTILDTNVSDLKNIPQQPPGFPFIIYIDDPLCDFDIFLLDESDINIYSIIT